MMQSKLKLEPTAAFVIDLALALFREDEMTRRYVERLDLSSGADLLKDHQSDGIYDLTKQVMCNRKYTIRHCVLSLIEKAESPIQIVFLAAGKSPVGLEIASRAAEKVDAIFEVDISPFEEKKKLYQELGAKPSEKISFVEQEIGSGQLIPDMKQVGFDPKKTTIVVLEGITHYLPEGALKQILAQFASGNGRNWGVIEYGTPFEEIAEWARPMARKTYESFEKRYHAQGMMKHNAAGLESLFKSLKGSLVEHFTMDKMERLRTKTNSVFKEPNSGWLEVVVGRF